MVSAQFAPYRQRSFTTYEVTGGSALPSWLTVCYAMTWYFPVPCIVAAYISEGGFGFSLTFGPLSGAGWPLPNVAIWQHPQGGARSLPRRLRAITSSSQRPTSW
jgi:hypothetical protein